MPADRAPADLLMGVPLLAVLLCVPLGLAIAFGARLRMKRLAGLVLAQIGAGVLAALAGGVGVARTAASAATSMPGLMAMSLLAVAVATLLTGAALVQAASRGSDADGRR